LRRSGVVGQDIGHDLLDSARARNLGEVLEEQRTDAAPLIGIFDRERHLCLRSRPRRRAVGVDSNVPTDAHDAFDAVGCRDDGGQPDVGGEVELGQIRELLVGELTLLAKDTIADRFRAEARKQLREELLIRRTHGSKRERGAVAKYHGLGVVTESR
jgi:hypothetical protein